MSPRKAGIVAHDPGWQPQAAEPNDSERLFLEGPKERWWELLRILRIGLEFLRGFRRLHFLGPCVTVFGATALSVEMRTKRST